MPLFPSYISNWVFHITDLPNIFKICQLDCGNFKKNQQNLNHINDNYLFRLKLGFSVTGNNASVRLANAVLALLCYSLRELPENAELVEKIVFNKNLDLLSLMQHKNSLLKYFTQIFTFLYMNLLIFLNRSRVCMLLRMIGRFSCCALQNVWSKEFNNALSTLLDDKNDNVRQVSLLFSIWYQVNYIYFF